VYALLCQTPILLHAQQNDDPIVFSDSNKVYFLDPLLCKRFLLYTIHKEYVVKTTAEKTQQPQAIHQKTPPRNLIKIHGNVLYDFNYRSYIDTPFNLSNIQQHYTQFNGNAIIAEKYPVDITLRLRQSNNIYLRNYADLNISFNGHSLNELAKQRVLTKVSNSYGKEEIEQLKRQFYNKSEESLFLEQWLSNDQRWNQYLEYKELLNRRKTIGADALMNEVRLPLPKYRTTLQEPDVHLNRDIAEMDDIDTSHIQQYVAGYEEKQARLQKLKEESGRLKTLYENRIRSVSGELADLKNKIHKAASYSEIKTIASSYGIKLDSSDKKLRLLNSIKSFGIGRSFIDYSELTVKNVSINGIHAEFTSKNYYAVASGTVDYRFRDIFLNTPHSKPQYVSLVRYGKMLQSGNQIIFSAYKGRKYANQFSDSASLFSNVFGVSVESRVQVSRNTYVVAEAAKSNISSQRLGTNSTKSGFDLKDKTTSALFVSFYSFIQKTKTKLRGNYRYQGANFQSFTIFFNQNNSVAWSLLADQTFLKNRLVVQAGIRKNEFTNPFAAFQYSSNVVFKSIMATMRLKKMPTVTVAYMPSSQFAVVENKISESRFYTFTTTASHFYKVKKVNVSSIAVYSRFYNSGSDSGFVYYNARNLHASQTFSSGRFLSTSTISIMKSPSVNFYTYEEGVTWIRTLFSAGIGAKYSVLNHSNRKIGGYANGNIQLKKVNADLSLSFEHGFLPGLNQSLIANDIGRVTIIKRF
jgi:hypothetical protein